MTYETPPESPEPIPQPAKKRRWMWPAIAVLALVAGIGIGGAVDTTEPTTAATVEPTSEPEPTADEASEPEPEPEPEPEFYEPTKDDFVVTLKTLGKECFGSAGCNISFRVELTSLYNAEVDPSKTYEVTYEIKGGDDPYINTLELTGDEYSHDGDESLGTPSSDSKLKAVVLDVTEF